MHIKMVVLAVALFVILSSCAVECWNTNSEMERLRCEQTTLHQQQDALAQMRLGCHQDRAKKEVGTNILTYGAVDEEDDSLHVSEEDSRKQGDPCFHYTVLDQAWRATNTTTSYKRCDRNVKWNGWYRLFYNGKSIQMPERCVPVDKCGTNSPLWLAGPHPKRRDGIVTRNVCGHWKKDCCAFKSTPIQVKKCLGNYYVYKFTQPTSCRLAYCADINTLVCGRCRRNQSCVSQDKINWRCKTKKRILSNPQIHFFASYPGQLTGKVNRIKYSKVLVNMGRAFNRGTGVFTAPVKGVYQFFFSTQTANTNLKTDLWLVVNGYWVAVSHTHVFRPSTVGNLSTYMTFLRKGAVVYVTHNSGRSWANGSSMTITFGGSLLAQWK
ncbi:uncharacterized protein LOC113156004 isoform X2 [Anabas testudineus]|uniref:uncharacterized protein LOC113156004 isoform X2 n=1 Tax=Anabas testudineus TaxID=64144 RepID=UPI000E4647F3|nr:uncharacterized protein LOC113156004 isoform X2 [Anabas testudineus]